MIGVDVCLGVSCYFVGFVVCINDVVCGIVVVGVGCCCRIGVLGYELVFLGICDGCVYVVGDCVKGFVDVVGRVV